jgi:hypothetical protein
VGAVHCELPPAQFWLVLVGNSNWKIDPLSTPHDAQILPSWLSIIERQMESPIPTRGSSAHRFSRLRETTTRRLSPRAHWKKTVRQ